MYDIDLIDILAWGSLIKKLMCTSVSSVFGGLDVLTVVYVDEKELETVDSRPISSSDGH